MGAAQTQISQGQPLERALRCGAAVSEPSLISWGRGGGLRRGLGRVCPALLGAKGPEEAGWA